ncbi:MAG: GntR family transcriptional regulator [Gemmatimonadales bacterium]
MFERIDPRSPTPLYAQIAERIKVAIAAGELAPGAALESVRALAGQLRVNPATVVQAYRELEGEGFVEMRQGSGTFVRVLSAERRSRQRDAQARQLVRAMLAEAARLGVTPTELRAAIQNEMKEGTR